MSSRKACGSKADRLKLLSQSGFNVPAFYVIPHDVDLANASILISEYESWKSLNGVESAAIRSSANLEDGTEASFAGQFETVLDVKSSTDFLSALDKVLSSKPSKSYSGKSGQVNAIVQAFVEPDIAGVIFSVNPSSGSSEYVINAAEGRGTLVVEGRKSTQYIVDRLSGQIDKITIGDKSPLTNKQIVGLAKLMPKMEELFGSIQDVEWAVKDNEIFVLQARPITKLSHLRLWDSSNLAESYPGIVLPLTFSIARRGYRLGYQAQAYEGGLNWYDLEANRDIFDSMIGIFNGRMYYNLLSWYRYISLFPGSSKNQKFLDDQIATQGEAIYLSSRKLPFIYQMKYLTRLVRRVIFFRRELKKFYKRYRDFEKDYSNLPAHGGSQLLMKRYAFIQQNIIPHFGRTLDNDFLVMTYNGWLKRLLRRWLPDENIERTNIIGAMSGVASAQQATELYGLAAQFREDKLALKFLNSGDYKKLGQHLSGSKLESRIADYLSDFGHRFAEDQKIESINPIAKKSGIYDLLHAYVQLEPKEAKQRVLKSSHHSLWTENGIKSKLSPIRRIIYAHLLKKLKRHLRIREHNRLLRGKVFNHMRELFPLIGQALVREGVIKNWKDIYYFEIDELEQLMNGAVNSPDLSERVTSRRQAYKSYKSTSMPERFITRGLPNLEDISIQSSKPISKKSSRKIYGLISSPGNVEGRAIVLTEPKIPKEPFDILVTSHTDPGWTPLIALAKGVIVEHGGMLSHAAIVTRELGIPSIIGAPNVTQTIKNGMRVRINTQSSCVEII